MSDNYLDFVKVLKRNELLAMLDLDKSTFDRMEARGEGPQKTKLSTNRIGYRVSDVKAWLDARRIDRLRFPYPRQMIA